MHIFMKALLVCLLVNVVSAQEMRTWSDATGRFKIQGKFVAVEGNKVKLEQSGGKLLEIELNKLSKADQTYVESLKDDNPFKAAGEANPFMPAKEGEGTGSSTSTPVVEQVVSVNWNNAEAVSSQADSDEWNFDGGGANSLGYKPRNVVLPPKTDFFEKLEKIAYSRGSRKMAIGYVMGGRGGGSGTSRIQIADMETGRIVTTASTSGEIVPIAFHDDGKTVLMRSNDFGFGKTDRLALCRIEGGNLQKGLMWTPHDDRRGADRDILMAEFLENDVLMTSSRSGRITLWDSTTAQPICYFESANGAVPGVSGDRRTIAFCTEQSVGLFDVASRRVMASRSIPDKLQWPYVAFSPSGKRIACIAFDDILCWDAATGELLRNFPVAGVSVHGGIEFPDDQFVLAKDQYLIDLENQIKVWDYRGANSAKTIGETTFFAVANHREQGAVMPTTIPHETARKSLDQALNQPDLFVFREGSTVQLDVGMIPGNEQGNVRQGLEALLQKMNCRIDNSAPVTLVASVSGPTTRDVSYHFAGDYKVNEYISKVEFQYEGKTIWRTQSSNVPGFISLKRGENIEGVLREHGKSANYGFFKGVVLPRFLQKPGAGEGSGSSQTLGFSNVTARGAR